MPQITLSTMQQHTHAPRPTDRLTALNKLGTGRLEKHWLPYRPRRKRALAFQC